MGIVGAVVMFVVFFFIALFLILPRGQATQFEDGEVEPGTPAGAPSEIRIGRKFVYAAIAAAAAVGVLAAVLASGVALTDFDFLFPASFKEPLLGGSPPQD